MKKVIVYYSYRGNTKSIAEMIQKSTGADIARIETVVPYDGDYNSVVNQGQDEVNSGYCPEIKPLNIDLSKYAALSRDIPITEYAPLKIKMAITGNGQASKEQVADMLKRMLHIPESDMLPFMDATDGLAAAYCHYLQMGRPTLTKEYSGWKDFINKNPDKIKR